MRAKLTMFVLAAAVTLFTAAEAQAPYFRGGSPGPNTVLGWNFGHFSSCGASDGWFWATVQEGGVGITNDPSVILLLTPACHNGNLIGVHVTSLNPFSWDIVVAYPFR